jgi:chromosome segregation ATPase
MAAEVKLEPGSRLQGWISSISPDEPLPNEENTVKATAMLPPLPDDLKEASDTKRSPNQLNLLRHLQNLAGQAEADYTALKKQFDERVNDRVGNAFDRADSLSLKLDEAKHELKKVKRELTTTTNTLASREATIQQQLQEIADAKADSDQKGQELTDLTESFQNLIKQHSALEEAKNAVDLSLLESLKENDSFKEQIRTLETTLQNSIVRTTEQEDALLHWQELSDTSQNLVAKLEKEKETLNQQLEENALITGKLRDKNNLLEIELQEALDEITELRNQIPDASVEELQFGLADAHQRIATLNSLLEDEKQAVAEAEERIIWHKANVKTAQRALEEARTVVSWQASQLEELQAEKEGGELTTGKWKTAVEEMATRLQQKEKDFQELEAEKSAQSVDFEEKLKTLQDSDQHKLLQIEALEDEIEKHLKQMDKQGERLAEIQANLVERELEKDQIIQQLKQARNKITWQTNFINKMKRVTSETIADLEARLEKSKQRNS